MDYSRGSPVVPSAERDDLASVLGELHQLRDSLLDAELRETVSIDAVEPRHRASAINLVHYVELRSHDIRALQVRLSQHGLSSLGRTESQVLASIDAVIHAVECLMGDSDVPLPRTPSAPTNAGLLSQNALSLLGPRHTDRPTRIMVTLPSEAASDPAMVRTMLSSGMDIARINCAHDDPAAWDAMIANVRTAAAELGQACLISMDLGGPKLRTGPLVRGPEVLKLKPVRDELGIVRDAARVWLGAAPSGAAGSGASAIPLRDPEWASTRQLGEKIRLVDARGSHRVLTVEQVHSTGCLVSFRRTVYFVPGTRLIAHKVATRIGPLPSIESSMTVRRGDRITLTADLTPAELTDGTAHRIGATLFEVFADTEPGDRVLIDDGKIATVIVDASETGVTVEVRSAGVAGTKLRAEKGINLPDSMLTLSALTEEDLDDLDFITRHADIVEMSFVRSPRDVDALLSHLETLSHLNPPGGHAMGVVLKIETVAAFDSLPQILLEAMRWGDIGVMIARGDLAVEAGFERLAELQEEILWLAEAAHVPVIWATEVLDAMARTGIPSRAEVTDAAMAERAECVMLNKGPYIGEAITMLADILRRMQDHMQKKRSLLRRLKAWDLGPNNPEDHREAVLKRRP